MDQRLRPWGLHEALLAPCKVTTDEVWGDIYTTVLEQALIDTSPMQRLRRVRQLGNSHLVYPGATHTRFSHSLGALRVVQDLLEGVIAQREGLHPVADLLGQWERRHPEEECRRKIAETVVLGRLGALLHDLCHVPFGHSIEDDLRVLTPHDENETRFGRLWTTICDQLPDRVNHQIGNDPDVDIADAQETLEHLAAESGALNQQLRPLIVSKSEHAELMRKNGGVKYPFVEDLVGNTICADLLDYLLRDHLNTGLPASLGRRFTSAFFTVPAGRGPFSEHAALNIMRNNRERTDVISELLKALRYRYELSERVLYHHGKLAADAMIGKALDLWSDAVWLRLYEARVADLNDAEDLLKGGSVPRLKQAVLDTVATEGARQRVRLSQQRAVEKVFEDEFLAHGDDGLLERIAGLRHGAPADGASGALIRRLERSASRLADDVLQRRLFEVAGHVGLHDAPATELYERFGAAENRLQLQEEAQRFAELGREPRVLIWLPSPKMRIKLARVLVDDGHHVDHFNSYEDTRGRRGGDVYRADSQLWGLWVFTQRDLSADDREAVLVYLAARLGVAWESLRDRYRQESWLWLPAYGLMPLLGTDKPDDDVWGLALETLEISARGSRPADDPDNEALLPDSRRQYRRRLAALEPVKTHERFTLPGAH